MTLASLTRENLARAAVEGLLCLLADATEAVRRQGVSINRVTLLGGGARSQAVRGLAPMILGVPVEVPEPGEYVARGAARQAAWALSGNDHPPRWELDTRVFTGEPTPEVLQHYRNTARDVGRLLGE
jgi:xylulokinase